MVFFLHTPMSYDDFIFYLPAFGSLFILLASVLASWLVWKLIRSRKKDGGVEKSPKM